MNIDTATQTSTSGVLRGEFNRIEVEGINAVGPLEERILDYLWEHGNTATVPQMYKALREYKGGGDEEISYATIRTTVARLLKKGLLHENRDDITFRYTVVVSREAYREQQAEKSLDVLVRTLGPELVARVLKKIGGRGASENNGSPTPARA